MIEYVIKKENVTPRAKNIAKKLIDESLLLINSIFEAENTILGRMFEEHVIPVNAVQVINYLLFSCSYLRFVIVF